MKQNKREKTERNIPEEEEQKEEEKTTIDDINADSSNSEYFSNDDDDIMTGDDDEPEEELENVQDDEEDQDDDGVDDDASKTDTDPSKEPTNKSENPNDEEPKQSSEKILNLKKDKRGIIYLSHIPAGLTISKIRLIMGQFGKVGRLFLVPHRTRPRQGRIKVYTEGWIEFEKKRIAKEVASQCNGRAVGGRKRDIFRDAIWSMKYLKRFKWHHLVEQIALEKAQRDQRLRFEIGMAKRETDFYMDMVNKSKRLARLKAKQEKNKSGAEEESSAGPSSSANQTAATYKQRRTFEDRSFQPDHVDVDLLTKIFS